ncbi:hypothetical protein A0H81_03813 [Grifola frondosa]|uniref:Uncharacterized protein n=1 Tax=Grifola frondosa TaxID=5627 RepID=A0A1C7MHT0_GRIFR|nr:hypothetical protein A0H81_03813 [Grifola frondosa]
MVAIVRRVGAGGEGSPSDGRGEIARWDLDDMGMWSLVLNPLARAIATFRQLMGFLAHNENRSPTLIVVRRLFLDISFILCLLSVVKMAWRRSGMRRKEVLSALRVLWNAVLGHKRPRIMIDRHFGGIRAYQILQL